MILKTMYKINQYLSFSLNEERYAVNVEAVQSVLELSTIMVIPQAPDYMRGVINLRGKVIPIIDLKLKFGIGNTEKTNETAVIVMELTLEDEDIVIGVLADAVHEVVEILPENIDPAPKLGTDINTNFIYGMGKMKDNFFVILDVCKIFTNQDLSSKASNRNLVKNDSIEGFNEESN